MLVLSRKMNQSIMIGDDVRIVVVAVDRDQVKLGIEAPREVPVHRSEIYEEIQRANRAAAGIEPESSETDAPAAAPASIGSASRAKLHARKKPLHH
jgi:carbon storage regulator